MKSLDKLSIRVIQGGMGVGISLGRLAGAVASCGGMGVISTADIGFREEDFGRDHEAANARALQKEISLARRNSGGKGLLAINAMVATTNFGEMVRQACEAGIDAVIAGAGLPLSLPEYVRGHDVLIAPIVSSAKAARSIIRRWKRNYDRKPDFIVVEGVKAGGHLGFHEEDVRGGTTQTLEEIVSDVVTVADDAAGEPGGIPVFAAGGVFDGSDVRRMLDQGAYGVQVATRFIATEECDATQGYKDMIINASEEDVMILKSPVGMPGRGLRTPLTAGVEAGERRRPTRCIRCIHTCDPGSTPYCITRALEAAWAGDRENGLFFCGSNVGRVDRMSTVREIMEDLKKGWETV